MKKSIIKLISLKKKKKNWEEIKPKKILVETSWQLGDCIINSVLLENLFKNNKEIEIDIFVRENSLEMLKYFPYIKNIYPYRTNKNKILRYIKRIYFALNHRNNYDLIISFERGINTFHLLWLKILNGKFLMSLNKNEKYGIKKEDIKMIDWYFEDTMDILKKFGILTCDRKYKIYIGPFEKIAQTFFDKSKVNIIFNYIGSTPNRTLLRQEVKEILNYLDIENTVIYLSSTPQLYNENKKIIEEISRGNVKILPKTNSIFEMASYIKYTDIVVSVDTSILHIASAYNKKIVGIYRGNREIIEYSKPNSDRYFIIVSQYQDLIKDLDKEEILKGIKLLK